MKKSVRLLAALGITFGLALTLAGCGKSSNKTVKVGVVGDQDAAIWKAVGKETAKEDHITLKIVNFTDYTQPNAALSDHSVDINAFQSLNFQTAWNKAHKTNIVAIGNTYFQPLALYSNKLKKLSAIKHGAQIAIPNDAANETRALVLLRRAGLIKLDKASLPTTKDVTENRLGLKFTTVDASQTARSLSSADAAVVNGNYASAAKLSLKDSLYQEHLKTGGDYINVVSTLNKNKHNATYKKIVKAYQSEATKKNLKKYYKGNTLPAW